MDAGYKQASKPAFCPVNRHGILGAIALICETEVPGKPYLPPGELRAGEKMGN